MPRLADVLPRFSILERIVGIETLCADYANPRKRARFSILERIVGIETREVAR